jgi:hypothetical protein
MASIGQLFYTPYNAESAFLTSVDLFFNSVDPNVGCVIEVLQTVNGQPTMTILGSAVVTNAVADTSGATPTTITFQDPIYLQADTLYFLNVQPIGNNPNYTLWTAVLGAPDNITGQTVTSLGGLQNALISSDQNVFTVLKNETLKINMYFANFTSQGTLYNNIKNYEFIETSEVQGTFIPGETILLQTGSYNTAVMSLLSNTAPVAANSYLTQTVNAVSATAYVYSVSNNTLYLTNVSSSFQNNINVSISTGGTLTSTVSTQNNYLTVVGNTVSVNVPYAALLNTNTYYSFTTSNNQTFISTINSINGNNVVLSNALGNLANGVVFINTLNQTLNSTYQYYQDSMMVVSGSTANNTVNYNGSIGKNLYGLLSGAYAQYQSLQELKYQTFNLQVSAATPDNTSIVCNNALTYSDLTSNAFTTFINIDNILINKSGVVLSRSKEIVDIAGAKSFATSLGLNTGDLHVTPFVYNSQKSSTFVTNEILSTSNVSGLLLYVNDYSSLLNANNEFVNGTIVYVNGNTSSYAVGQYMNTSSIFVTGNNVPITTGSTITNAQQSNAATVATVINVVNVSEDYNVVLGGSRYISQKVTLSANQTAEDLQLYISAYRPANTQFYCYGKILNSQDDTNYYNAPWSRLVETSTTVGSYSATGNTGNVLDITYGLPYSGSETNCSVVNSSNTAVVTFTQTPNSLFLPNSFCYVNAGNTFYVSTVTSSNSTAVILNSNFPVSGVSGVIAPIYGLTCVNGAFKYTTNNGVVRYMSLDSTVYDTYNSFAIKIVPLSDNGFVVPLVDNMRAIALQV